MTEHVVAKALYFPSFTRQAVDGILLTLIPQHNEKQQLQLVDLQRKLKIAEENTADGQKVRTIMFMDCYGRLIS